VLEILSSPIVLQQLIDTVAHNRYGAIITFEGRVRERSEDNRQVCGLSYEAYEAMAVSQMKEIVVQARASFGDCAIAMVHRVGELAAGEVSVAVAVAAPHRREAFLACEFAIDALKERAAIWKKEHFRDQSGSVWRANLSASEVRR